jgi:surface protein
MSGFFSASSGDKYIEGIDLSGWDVSKVTNCDDFFGGITNWPESKKPNFTNCNPN